MPPCAAEPVTWKQRRAFRLSNPKIEVTVLLGGGHIADLRLCNSPTNVLWEAPWPTLEPCQFSEAHHGPLYGERTVGQMLSGYTGHALVLGYFGMPSLEQAQQGLALHGEAASAEWHVTASHSADSFASVTLAVNLPRTGLHFCRTLTVAADAATVSIHETLSNRSPNPHDIQWVQHAAFGEPLFRRGEASLALSGTEGLTWPLGYEDHVLLPNSQTFAWPVVPAQKGNLDLSQPFLQDGTGFVAAVRADPHREDAFIAVHNRRLSLASGYLYPTCRFPWICLWEENRARAYPPWNGRARVRGVEFGTSPFPLGLAHAQQMQSLFDTPVLARLEGNAQLSTSYDLFLTETSADWQSVADVTSDARSLILHSNSGERLQIARTPAN